MAQIKLSLPDPMIAAIKMLAGASCTPFPAYFRTILSQHIQKSHATIARLERQARRDSEAREVEAREVARLRASVRACIRSFYEPGPIPHGDRDLFAPGEQEVLAPSMAYNETLVDHTLPPVVWNTPTTPNNHVRADTPDITPAEEARNEVLAARARAVAFLAGEHPDVTRDVLEWMAREDDPDLWKD